MGFDGKISNILCVLGTVVSLSLLITLLATGGAVLLCVAAGLLTVVFVMMILTAKKQQPAEPDTVTTEAAPPPPVAAEPVETKPDTIQTLSSQIRTPLSNLASIANLMSKDFNPDNKKMLVDSLVASVETIAELFDINGGDGNSFGVAANDPIRVFDLRSLITQSAELTPGLEVKLEVYGELPRLKGDSVKMRRILFSIFDFFLQHTPKDSLPVQVTIVVNRVRIPITPIKYRFDVKSDIGISIDPDAEIPGLNIAKRLIGELKGNIKHRFEDGNAFIYFNVCFDGEETATADSVSSAVQSGQMEVFTNETAGFANVLKPRAKSLEEADIIVCDDNPINQKVMSLSLDKHVRSIALASNGQECLDLVSKSGYDIILMDIQMPVLDGYAATKEIRHKEEKSGGHVPIIAVTANTMSGDRQHCLEIGMDDYISKPFQIEDVLRKMGEQLAKHPVG